MMQSMNDTICEIKPQALLDEFAEILAFVQTSFQQARTAHEVETGLWQRMLNLGHSIFAAWLDLFGEGDAGERIVLEDGREVRQRSPEGLAERSLEVRVLTRDGSTIVDPALTSFTDLTN